MVRMLARVSDGFSRRMALHRRMVDNIGLDLTEAEARRNREDYRAALCACARCTKADACAAWLDQGHPDLPLFCPGRSALLRLAAIRAKAPTADAPTFGRRARMAARDSVAER